MVQYSYRTKMIETIAIKIAAMSPLPVTVPERNHRSPPGHYDAVGMRRWSRGSLTAVNHDF